MRLRVGLLLWVFAILFPIAWLRNFSSHFKDIFDKLASPLWVHVVMHALSFVVLAMLLIRAFHLNYRRKGMILVLAAVSITGFLQEFFQALSSGNLPYADIVFDLGVDLMGGAIGFLVYAMISMGLLRRNSEHTEHPDNLD